MNALVIFEVSSGILEIRQQLANLGYWSSWAANGKNYFLPYNTMWRPHCDLLQAKSDVINVIAQININNAAHPIHLKRCISVPVNPWDGITGEPYPPESDSN